MSGAGHRDASWPAEAYFTDPLDDDGLPGLGAFVGSLAEGAMAIETPHQRIAVERLVFDLPLELDIGISPEGHLGLTAGPPMQKIETGVMPIFHRLAMTIEKDHAD